MEAKSSEDSSAFEALFKAQYSRIARLICRVIGDPAQAEELAAEVFWKFHRKGPAHDRNLEGWLSRTAVRAALDSLRKQTRRKWYERLWPVSPPPNPEDVLARNEERDRVRHILAGIKPQQAELLVLRSHGLSYAELGGALGKNPASIGTLLARAQASFRKEYVKRYGER